MSFVVSGSVAYDYLMRFPGYFRDNILPEHLESISLSFLVDDMVKRRGGVAPNICYSMSLLGETPFLFAAVGEDFGDYRRKLVKAGVDCRFARNIPGKFTASFFVNTDLANNQIASFYTGAMLNSSELKLQDLIDEEIDTTLFIVAPCDPGAMSGYCDQCKALGIPYAFDPSQQIVRMEKNALRDGITGAKFLFCNEYELELLKKHSGLSEQDMCETVECLVNTLGIKGARIIYHGEEHFIPIFDTPQITEPTGVGDAFRAGFLVGFYHDLGIDIAGRMGSLAAAYVLEKDGPQKHFYTREEFVQRYREQWDDQGALDCLL